MARCTVTDWPLILMTAHCFFKYVIWVYKIISSVIECVIDGIFQLWLIGLIIFFMDAHRHKAPGSATMEIVIFSLINIKNEKKRKFTTKAYFIGWIYSYFKMFFTALKGRWKIVKLKRYNADVFLFLNFFIKNNKVKTILRTYCDFQQSFQNFFFIYWAENAANFMFWK